jgi:hypothetical protein
MIKIGFETLENQLDEIAKSKSMGYPFAFGVSLNIIKILLENMEPNKRSEILSRIEENNKSIIALMKK